MELERRIAGLLAPTLGDMGYEIIRVTVSGERHPRVQIMAEPADGSGMTVDRCAEVSRAVSALLDVEDPIDQAYTLEVSSPGIDRPLVRSKDFERFAGFEAKLELSRPIDGRRRFRGRLRGLVGGMVRIDVEGEELELPFDDVQKAKLVLTDDLLAATAAAEPEGDEDFEDGQTEST